MCAVSLDHLVGAAEQWQWNREAERLRDFQIDGHLDFRGLLNRKVSGFFALKNAAGIKADSAISTSHIASVAHETARRNELAVAIDGWDSVLSRQFDQPITLAQEEIFTAYHECAKPLSDNGREN